MSIGFRNVQRVCAVFLMLLIVLAISGAVTTARAADAAPGAFADPSFATLWNASDAPVASGQTSHSYFYGPQPWAATSETYTQSTNGHRLVQYFDKARMEVTSSTASPTDPYYVSTGLLTREMVSGRLQTGDSDTDFVQRAPAQVPVAGDPINNPTTPSYAAMASVTTTLPGQNTKTARTGLVLDSIDSKGVVTTLSSAPANVNYGNFYSQTGHTLADVFSAWLTDPRNGFASDPNTAPGTNRTAGWIYVMGLPISDPYWITGGSTIAGQSGRVVLVQLFQRRVLTYEPGAPTAYQVQMGNAGQHYYRWRYGVTQPAISKTRLTIATTRTNFNRLDQSSAFGDIYQTDSDGSNKTQVNLVGSTVYDLVLNNVGTTATLPNADYYPSVSNIYPAPTGQGNKFAFIYHNSTASHYGLLVEDRNHATPIYNDINVGTNSVVLPAYNGNGTIARWYPAQLAWANSGNAIAFTSYRPATTAADNQTFYTDVSIIDLTKAAGTAPTVVYKGTAARKTPGVVHLRFSPDDSRLAFAEVVRNDGDPTTIDSQTLYVTAGNGSAATPTKVSDTGDLLDSPSDPAASQPTSHVNAEWTPLAGANGYELVYFSYANKAINGVTFNASSTGTKRTILTVEHEGAILDFFGFAPGSNRFAFETVDGLAIRVFHYRTADLSDVATTTEFLRIPISPLTDCTLGNSVTTRAYNVRWFDPTQLGFDIQTTTNAGGIVCTPTPTTAAPTTTAVTTTTAATTTAATTTAATTTAATTTAATTTVAATTTTASGGNVHANAVTYSWQFYVANYNVTYADVTSTNIAAANGIESLSTDPYYFQRSSDDGPVFISASPTDYAMAYSATPTIAGGQVVDVNGRANRVAPLRGPNSNIGRRSFTLNGAFWVNAFVTNPS